MATYKCAIVDCESTGLGNEDEPICLGVVYGEVDEKGRFISVSEWYGQRQPGVPIKKAAQRVHGLTADDLAGKAFNMQELTTILNDSDILIAHNAKFDARMLEKVLPDAREREWRCTVMQWVWPKMQNKKLDTLCETLNISRGEKHNALEDAKILAAALLRPSGKTERSSTYLKKLLDKNSAYVKPVERQTWEPMETTVHFVVDFSTGNIIRSGHSPIDVESEPHNDEGDGFTEFKAESAKLLLQKIGGIVIIVFLAYLLWMVFFK